MEKQDEKTVSQMLNENEETAMEQSPIQRKLQRTAVKVRELRPGEYQKKGTITAVLEQLVVTTSIYPGIRTTSNLQQNMFGEEEFSAEPQEYVSKTMRVAFVNVPEDKTAEQVQKAIPKNAHIYRILDNRPILSDNQKNAIDRGLTTLDVIGDGQALRYPDLDENGKPHPHAGELILFNGKVQYKVNMFWMSPKEDIDYRGKHDEYRTPKIKAELGEETINVKAEEKSVEIDVDNPQFI